MWTIVSALAGEGSPLDELPFHRALDVGITFPGLPDVAGVRAELWPTRHLSVELGASTAIFLASLTGTVNYRWDLRVAERANGSVNQLMLGPAVGARYGTYLCFDACMDPGLYADGLASLQYDHWFRPHFGLQVQIDAGITVLVGRIETQYGRGDVAPVIPNLRLGSGFAF
jgi:hypothetical protein